LNRDSFNAKSYQNTSTEVVGLSSKDGEFLAPRFISFGVQDPYWTLPPQ
jgi:hypothetical protein